MYCNCRLLVDFLVMIIFLRFACCVKKTAEIYVSNDDGDDVDRANPMQDADRNQ